MDNDQIEAITHVYMDICAVDQLFNGIAPFDRRSWDDIAEKSSKTKDEMEQAFPFLMQEVSG